GDEIDIKTISKWARALRYVAHCKKPQTRLKTFMKEAAGSTRVLTDMRSPDLPRFFGPRLARDGVPCFMHAPCGAGCATGQGAKARTPQRPGPLHDGPLFLAVEPRTRSA